MADPVDLTIMRGDDYRIVVNVTDGTDPIDLTDYTATAQIRDSLSASAALLAEFDVTITDEAGGVVELVLSHTDTATLAKGYWDLQIVAPTTDWTTTVVGGAVTITPDVTRVVV